MSKAIIPQRDRNPSSASAKEQRFTGEWDLYDVVVIGAGPAGLTAGANAALRGLDSLVLEKQEIAGGLPTMLYPDKIIRDHPGFPVGILGKELSRMLVMQAQNAGTEIRCGEEALTIEKKESGQIEVKTAEGSYQTKRVILCTGIYNIPRKLKNLKGYTGPNLHYKIENLTIFRKRRVVIVGGGDHAFDTALQLGSIAESITILDKHHYPKAKESSVKSALEAGAQVLSDTEILRALKDKQRVISRVQVSNNVTGEKKILPVDELFIAIGFEPVRKFLESNGFKLGKDGSLEVDRSLQTNVEGVFAAGDVTGEVRLISTACAEGIIAAVHAFEEIKRPYWIQ